MCGIFGVGLLNGCEFIDSDGMHRFLSELFKKTSERGHIASGIAITNAKNTHVLKKDVSATEFVESKSYKDLLKTHVDLADFKVSPISIIGHCRVPTKGTPTNENNNHPIISEEIVGVHNGHVTNDEALFTTYMARHDAFKRDGQVDSEIIFRLLHHYINVKTMVPEDAIKRVTEELSGNYACAFVNSNTPYHMYLFRNFNPTTVLLFEKVGLLVFASIKNHITEAIEKAKVDFGDPLDLNMGTSEGIGYNLFSNTHKTFELVSRNMGFGCA